MGGANEGRGEGTQGCPLTEVAAISQTLKYVDIQYVTEIYKAMMDKDVKNTASDPKKSLNLMMDAMDKKSKLLRDMEIRQSSDVVALFNLIFFAKKYGREVAERNSPQEVNSALAELKDVRDYDRSVEKFTSLRGGEKEDLRDMAREIIHFLDPVQYPHWTRWIWNEEKDTGAVNYVIKEGVKIQNRAMFQFLLNEVREVLEVFGHKTGDYKPTTIFMVYSYVRYLDYATHLAVDKKAGGMLPTHLGTTALVLGIKPFIKVVNYANS